MLGDQDGPRDQNFWRGFQALGYIAVAAVLLALIVGVFLTFGLDELAVGLAGALAAGGLALATGAKRRER